MPDFDPKQNPREFLQALAGELGLPLAAVRSPAGDVVAVAKPANASEVFGAFARATAGRDPAALKALVLACVAYPEPAEAKRVLEAFPALLDKLDQRVLELCGGDFERVDADTFKAPDGRVVVLQKPHNASAIYAKLKLATRETAWTEVRDFILGFVKSSRTDAISVLNEWPAMVPALKAQCDVHCGSEAEDLGKF
jgi:hypothetical protein